MSLPGGRTRSLASARARRRARAAAPRARRARAHRGTRAAPAAALGRGRRPRGRLWVSSHRSCLRSFREEGGDRRGARTDATTRTGGARMSRQSRSMPTTRAALRGWRAGATSRSRRRGRRATGPHGGRARVADRPCYPAPSTTAATSPSGGPSPSSEVRRARGSQRPRRGRARSPRGSPRTRARAPSRPRPRRSGVSATRPAAPP